MENNEKRLFNHGFTTAGLVFASLWFCLLLPKELQFAFFTLVIIWRVLLLKQVKLPNRIFAGILFFSIINAISILYNSMVGQYESSRIIAAWNTCLIWVVSIIISSYVLDEHQSIDKIAKLLFINMVILFLVYIFTKYIDIQSLKIFEQREAWRVDWVSSGKSTRFRGFMEYDTLVSLFVILQFPLSFYYVSKKHNTVVQLMFIFISALLVYESKSRIGLVCFLVLTVLAVFRVIDSLGISSKNKIGIKVFIIALIFVFIIVEGDMLKEALLALFSSRQSSTNARTGIYIRSIEKTLNESPIIGIGIKEMAGDYPLGSHSTIVGVLYKTGIIGLVIWVIGLIMLLKKTVFLLKNKLNGWGNYFIIGIIVFLGCLAFEDLDGADWLIVVFFSLIGIYRSIAMGKIKMDV